MRAGKHDDDTLDHAMMIAFCGVLLIIGVLLIRHIQIAELEEQLSLERGLRLDAEGDARRSREQLDGALGHISKLKATGDDPPAD